MDLDYDRRVNLGEFKKAIKDYKLSLSDEELTTLFNYLDIDGEGKMSIDEACLAFTGELNNFRRDLVVKAFDKIDTDQDNFIQVNKF
jgi:Ca2+-binding EF-hand superfamily protein